MSASNDALSAPEGALIVILDSTDERVEGPECCRFMMCSKDGAEYPCGLDDPHAGPHECSCGCGEKFQEQASDIVGRLVDFRGHKGEREWTREIAPDKDGRVQGWKGGRRDGTYGGFNRYTPEMLRRVYRYLDRAEERSIRRRGWQDRPKDGS